MQSPRPTEASDAGQPRSGAAPAGPPKPAPHEDGPHETGEGYSQAPARRALACDRILGVALAITNYDEVLDWMQEALDSDRRAYVSAAAVNLVMAAREDPAARAAVNDPAALLVPDGQPLVWALQLLGHRRATRVYGPELMARFCARAAAAGTPIFLYGGRDDAALALLARRLRERFPELVIAGGHAPPFRPLTATEEQEVAATIDASGARVVWVGTGQPKQEIWMARMRGRLQAPLLVGVGAAFDFHAGLVRQAPPWIGRAGLEWAFRLAQEPRRLWRRYASQNPRFIAAFARQWLSRRLDRRRSP